MSFASIINAAIVAFLLFVLTRIFGKKGSAARRAPDRYNTYEELQEGLRGAGLESSNLIIGIDYTKSNEWTGRNTFGGRCLHELAPHYLNPYQSVINIIGRTLETFDDDKLIPAFGFGDSTTADRKCFPFFPNRIAVGFSEVLNRYTEITPKLELSGPTNFAPLIHEAIDIVKREKSYHILVIVADGQVTEPHATESAIVEASNYPLSIIMVGVGDGPWDQMEQYDDQLPQRKFDNFQFVNFHEVMTKYDGSELVFATKAMMEIPDQYSEIRRLNLFANCR